MSDDLPFSNERRAADDGAKSSWGPCRTSHAPWTDERFEVPLRGIEAGPATRCVHYHGPRDRIAIRFSCCGVFYPCRACHREATDHDAERWPPDRFDAPAILCGSCRSVLSIEQYLEAEHSCPSCGAAFNPGCAHHYEHYFQIH